MAGFLLGILEGMLGLTDDERAVVEPALPYAKAIVDALNAHIDDIMAINGHITVEQGTIKRLSNNYRKLGPNISQLLGDGWVDIGTTMAAVQDIELALQVCPATEDIAAIYNRAVPALNIVIANWPKIKPAVAVLIAAYHRKGMTVQALTTTLPNYLRR